MRTKRWNDPVEPDDGLRLLICRYRPRGVRNDAEPWDAWSTALSPSKALHAAEPKPGGPAPAQRPTVRARRASKTSSDP